MKRTQIYLDDEIYRYLTQEKKRTQLSFSEIIRNTCKQNMRKDTSDIVSKMERAAGSWKDSDLSPETYVRTIRKDRPV